MAWGTELWDQFDNVSSHTLKGLEFLEKYSRFQKDRCDVENRYAADLRGLVKKYVPKKKEEEDMQFSVHAAYRRLLAEVGDLAGQHELVAEQLATSVVSDIVVVIKELKDERKQLLQEGARLHVQLQNQRLQLDKSKKSYEKAFREAEKALDAYRRADADLNLSRAEVEKQKMASSIKNQQCEDGKNEYANQLQKTNDLQHQHYAVLMPALFGHLQGLDERRARCMQAHIRRAVGIERHVFPIIHTCLDGILAAADNIDPDQDSQLVVERYKSGFEPPDAIPFEDLSEWRPGEAPLGQLPPPPASSPRPSTVKGTLSTARFKKRGGIFGIFSGSKNSLPNSTYDSFVKEDLDNLPPNQRRKRIQQRMDDLASKISQETSARDGLMKMKGVYEGNPALGDPMTIESQLRENTQHLEKLRIELHKYQRLLDGGDQRSSLSEPDSTLSRSASDSSMARAGAAAHGQSAPSTPPSGHGCSNSPESGLGTSHTSLPDSESEEEPPAPDAADGPAPAADGRGQQEDELDYADEPLPVLGTAQALYAFDASSEGSIPMQEGEQLLVIELDQGDGWTRVRRQDSLEEGFVPTAYLQVLLHPSC